MGCRRIFGKIIGFFIALLVGIGILSRPMPQPLPQNPPTVTIAAPDPTPSPTAASAPTPTVEENGSSGPIQEAQPSPTLDIVLPEPGSVCPYDPEVAALIERLDQADWSTWIEILSGERPAAIGEEMVTIRTRWSESMFAGDPDARAYDFVYQQLLQWGLMPGETLIEHSYTPFFAADSPTWKNLIVRLPGTDPLLSQEEVLLTAHLDSTAYDAPEDRAPGADDNGSGVATLLEAVKVLKDIPFKRTITIIFFTGEEIGLKGSRAYVAHHYQALENVVGVINLDMFGYDADNDRCFELHVGEMEASQWIGSCLTDTIAAYDLGIRYDYLIGEALGYSDHAAFWEVGVGAVEVLENFTTHDFADGCGEADKNPHYHTADDLIGAMNLDTAHRIAVAAIAATARLAEPARGSN
jgi:leucyl aminopeptidase